MLSVLAVICGADSFVAIAPFGRLNEEWLRTFPGLPNGIPSHDTPGRVFARLDAARFEECFRDRAQAAFQPTGGRVVHVDGKCLRGSHDRGLEPLHPDRRLGLGQPSGAGPDRGEQQIQRNHGYPGAACACRSWRAAFNGEFIWHSTGSANVPNRPFTAPIHPRPATLRLPWVGKSHGRIEIRRCRATGDPDLLARVDPDREWRDPASLVRVESERRCGNRVSTEVRCFIPACPQGQAATEAVRKYWSIENAHYRVLDVAFGEADSRIRTGHAAHNTVIPGASSTSGWRLGTRTACAN